MYTVHVPNLVMHMSQQFVCTYSLLNELSMKHTVCVVCLHKHCLFVQAM